MKKKIIVDAILNIVSTTMPIIVLQIIIFPLLANKLGNNDYGLFVTLVGLFTLVSHPFGNSLNNVRLLQNNEYKKKNIQGDFNLLLLWSLVINSVLIIAGTLYYEKSLSLLSIILIATISSMNLIRGYLIVAFRLTLNYKAILLNNLILILGYTIGFFLFIITNYWQFIYACGYFLSLIYIIKNSSLVSEKVEKTPLFKGTAYKNFILFVSSFLQSSLSYADRLLLFPLLGPQAVSVYYSAAILGKIISMGVGPISSVMLSYLAKMEKIKMKSFFYLLTFIAIVGMLGYFICIILSRPILEILYPNWVEESMDLIYITTATAIFNVMSSVINPLILRFKNINWQILIGGVNFSIYIIGIIVFYNLYGLVGFCFGILIASIIKLLLMIFVFVFNLNKNNVKVNNELEV